jgi:hypothetical protein
MMGTLCPKHVESDRQINIFEKISALSWFTIHKQTPQLFMMSCDTNEITDVETKQTFDILFNYL